MISQQLYLHYVTVNLIYKDSPTYSTNHNDSI